MTKDEALDIIVQKYRDGIKQDIKIAYCDEIKWNCFECPFRHGDTCQNDIAEKLVERLIEVEERQKTNLQHYIDVTYMDDGVFRAFLKPSVAGDFNKSKENDFYKWLLLPHKPQKPKYRLTQFEYDLLKSCYDDLHGIKDSWMLDQMQDRGYFKNIPKDKPIRDILNDCEVVRND